MDTSYATMPEPKTPLSKDILAAWAEVEPTFDIERVFTGDDIGGSQGRAGGEPHEQALLGGRLAGPLHGLVGGDVKHLVVDRRVEDRRDEPGAESLQRMRGRVPA